MPLELKDLKDMKIAPLKKHKTGGVDWEGLFEALCTLGMGPDGTGFSVVDVHLMTREFATVEYPSDGYPISRQRTGRKMKEDWYENWYAIRFTHPNAKGIRYAFQLDQIDVPVLDKKSKLWTLVYHAEEE